MSNEKLIIDFVKSLNFESSYQCFSAWIGHEKLAHFLIKTHKPKTIVELGVYNGFSYFSFCQTVHDYKLETKCFGIDNWQGDPHAGLYDEKVYKEVLKQNKKYQYFSELIKKDFNSALADFKDHSIDFLHIDGYHTYDAVKSDFTNWLPKCTKDALILFHDVNVFRDDFGVYKLFNELKQSYSHFTSPHAHGLGIITLSNNKDNIINFLNNFDIQTNFSAILSTISTLNQTLTQRSEENEQQVKTINTLNQTLSERDANLQYFISAKSEIFNSTSWRVTYPIRLVGDFIKCLKNMANQKFTLVKHIPYRLLTYEPIWKICKKIGKAAIKVGFSASWIFSIRKRMYVFQQNYPLVQNMIAIDKSREDLTNYLPSKSQKLPLPQAVSVTVIIPVYRGLEETKRCLNSVLRSSGKVPVKILVIDDCTPEPEISSWLETIAASGKIRLLKNKVNQGFVASVNLGIIESGNQDVVLLNSDTVVNADWLDRLVCHAYLNPRIGSVTPFSNNATICSWPSIEGGDLLNGISIDAIDEACSVANRGRQVELPTAVGFCMYIRRDCLTEVGLFDAAAFGKGYGEENDFCMRAAAIGWKHVLACDTFVYHAGETSFGKNSNHRTTAWEVLIKRHPDYPELVQRHIKADKAASARLAVAAALYKAASKPVILLITHSLGGGVDRHVKDLIDESDQCANLILLNPTLKGIQLSVPQIKGLSSIIFYPTEVLMLVELLKSFGVSRCHIHHWIGNEMDICKLIDSLGVPFDLTIHDYYSICPRINLVRPAENNYCGEPGPGECNTCIADLSTQGITDITAWRNRNLWMFNEAERVICPSEDTKRRIMLYYPHSRLMVAPHQFVEEDLWSVKVPQLKKGERMRILILGVVAIHKGLENLIAAAKINSKLYEFIVIGYTDPPIPYRLRRVITVTGRYEENELNSLISKADAHAVWFPNICPETYSYTLSSALKTKLPIIAPTLGTFPERLENRPLTWLFDENSDTSKLNKLFEQIHDILSKQTATDLTGKRKTTTNNFYKSDYFLPHQRFEATIGKSIYSLKRDKFLSILILPDLFSGNISPSGSIRLAQPIDLIGSFAEDILFEYVDRRSVFHRVADILICQRHAFDTVEDVNHLIKHCRKYQIRLVYDLDDDLINIPEDHSEATSLCTFVPVVKELLKAADTVWVSTPALATTLTDLRSDIIVIPNGHDNRLWGDPIAKQRSDKVRIVFMGTATHNSELAFLEPVALELMHRFGNKVIFEIVGIKSGSLPKGMIRKSPENYNVTYPFFVEWFRRQHWDIAVAPLLESSFNSCKSAIKLMDYAALRLPIVASRHPEYEAAFGGDHGIIFAENDQAVWIEKLSMLIEAPDDIRAHYSHLSWERYKSQHTLYHQRKFREMQLRNVVA